MGNFTKVRTGEGHVLHLATADLEASLGATTAELIRDTIGTALVAGANVTITVDDAADTITVAATGSYTAENARDDIGAALVAGDNVTITVDDPGNTITIAQTVTSPTLLASDTFDRADHATSLGSTDGTGTLDPLAWVQQAGTWGIKDARMYCPTSPGIATLDLGTADVDITLTVGVSDVNGEGIILRYVDASNYIYMVGDTGQCILQKREAGVNSSLITTFGVVSAGTTMRVWAKGSTIKVYLNGALEGSCTSSFNTSATKHGVRMQGTSQRIDNFSAWSTPTLMAAPLGPAGGDLYGFFPAPSVVGWDSYVAASVTGSITVNWLTARVQKLTLTGNITPTFVGATSSKACGMTLYLVQDATGSRTVTWPAAVKWPSATAPTLSTAAGSIDVVDMETFDGGTNWYATLRGKAYA